MARLALAAAQGRPRDGIGEQVHRVPGDDGEEARAVGRGGQGPYEGAVRTTHRAGARRGPGGKGVEPVEGITRTCRSIELSVHQDAYI